MRESERERERETGCNYGVHQNTGNTVTMSTPHTRKKEKKRGKEVEGV